MTRKERFREDEQITLVSMIWVSGFFARVVEGGRGSFIGPEVRTAGIVFMAGWGEESMEVGAVPKVRDAVVEVSAPNPRGRVFAVRSSLTCLHSGLVSSNPLARFVHPDLELLVPMESCRAHYCIADRRPGIWSKHQPTSSKRLSASRRITLVQRYCGATKSGPTLMREVGLHK